MYDNIGDPYFSTNVDAAGKAVAAGALDRDEKVVVYHRMSSGNAIYELVKDASAQKGFSKEELKKYAYGENAQLSKETMAAVVGDIRALYPDASEWGLAFGSHGRGWIPKSSTVSVARKATPQAETASQHPYSFLWEYIENPLTRFFESNRREKLDVSEFIDALDGKQGDRWEWDFIILDDCFMASVEALYDMRSLARYLIASPTEIMMEGFPYDRVVESVFGDWSETGFMDVGEGYVDYYRGKSDDYPCATVAVVKTSEMDALAESVKRLNLMNGESDPYEYGIQYLERFYTPGHLFYDLGHYLETIRKNSVPTEYNAFRVQLDRAVVYAGHTERFFSAFGGDGGGYVTVNPDHFSGLAVFIPWSRTASLWEDYRQTAWYGYVYGD